MSRVRILPALGVTLALGVTAAVAAGWSAYENAFPAAPCQDGWAACVTPDGARGPGMAGDAAGRPLPSDLRVGWFDLKPTASFSPFVGLSAYEGPVGGQVAQAAPPVAERPAPTPRQDDGVVDAAPVGERPAPVASQPVSQPVASQPVASQPVASQPVAAATPTQPTATPVSGGGMRPGAPSSPTTMATPTTSGASSSPTATPVAAKGTTPTPAATPQPLQAAPAATPAPVAAAPADDTCDDLVKLEPSAMMGQLRTGQVKCLEGRIGQESAQTSKDKVSRILIANAEAKGDKGEWEKHVKRHLEDIDRSDPDLCFKYALQLSRGGAGRAQGVIRWADYALENKHKWTGNTYKTRVFNLYKLKAEAANKLWQDAEQEYTTKERSDENEAKVTKFRGQAKDYAREWLDYAKASGQDTKTAMALCVSAAGNRAFCEGG